MSFALTTEQVRARAKTVTRRIGWAHAKPGTVVQPVEKNQGLKKGEKVTKIGGPIRFTDVRFEPLNAITKEDVIREGFPEMTPFEFITMFCQHNKCQTDVEVTRIEFEYGLDDLITQIVQARCQDAFGMGGQVYRCCLPEGHQGGHAHNDKIIWSTPQPSIPDGKEPQ